MSAFTETILTTKLLALNSSQQSIQTLSLWLIHHRKHSAAIVKVWYRLLQKAPESKKLTFLYLANDVIQNSKKKGPEYGKEFFNCLPKVFSYIGSECSDEKLFRSLERILSIWEERGVYDKATINDYRSRLKKDKDSNENDKSPDLSKSEKKRKIEEESNHSRSNSKKLKAGGDSSKPSTHISTKSNGTPHETSVSLSPHIPLGDPPEPEELIEVLTKLMDNSAASDVIVRERIANFPKEISDLNYVAKLEDKEQAKQFSEKVNEAVQILNDYNNRLATEMENRTKLATMLRDFHSEQNELLAQAETRLEEYNQKLSKMKEVQREIKDHLSNLPDLSQLPDVTGGLAPLPSAGDLFNLH